MCEWMAAAGVEFARNLGLGIQLVVAAYLLDRFGGWLMTRHEGERKR